MGLIVFTLCLLAVVAGVICLRPWTATGVPLEAGYLPGEPRVPTERTSRVPLELRPHPRSLAPIRIR